MKKSIFLYVYGEDYSALHFEENFDVNEVYNQMISEGVSKKVLDSEDYIEVKILEFNEVDNDFVYFVLNEICDYDVLKSQNIYRV